MTPRVERVEQVPPLPPRAESAHKHQMGRVGILAGSHGMSGAAVLCGLGALRGGAGLVRVYCGESVQPIVSAGEPCLMTHGVRESVDGIWAAGESESPRVGAGESLRAGALTADALDWPNVIALGPGLGITNAATAWDLASRCAVPLVIDADGLNYLAALPPEELSKAIAPRRALCEQRAIATILTPHAGELARLCRAFGVPLPRRDLASADATAAQALAERTGLIVVAKGPGSVVCEVNSARARVFVNSSGNPGMAAGGMGDVLTGLIAALIGQGMPAFDACCRGVFAHGASADELARTIGPVGYLAREVADAIPGMLHRRFECGAKL